MNLREGWEGLSPAQNNTPRVDEIDLVRKIEKRVENSNNG